MLLVEMGDSPICPAFFFLELSLIHGLDFI